MSKEKVLPFKKKKFCRLWIIVLSLLLAGSLSLMVSTPARAEPSESLEICGDGVSNPLSFTLPQLQDMEQYQHVYSTINTWPTKRWYIGQGVKLRSLLDMAGIKEDARLIIFTSNDGYTVTLTVKELLKDKRYYYPCLMEASTSDGSVPGSSADAQEVEPILALISSEGSDNPDDMNDMNTLLLLCGQRAVTEQTNNLFLKYVSKIEVLTTPPQKWENPKANKGSGEVLAGTLLELNSKRNDTDKVHYTTDGSTPTINSPIFNWSAKRWWSQRPDNLDKVNRPIELNSDTVIKAITIGPGKEDSDVVTFSYQIGFTDSLEKTPGGPPTGVTLDQSQISLTAGGTFELEATVGPNNAVDKSVTWSSSDTRVATVDNYGLVTVVGPGTAIITVKTVVGDFTANCTVQVTDESAVGQGAAPTETSLNEDEVQENPIEPEVPEAEKPDLAPKEVAATDSTTDVVPEPPVEPVVPAANQRYLAPKQMANVESTTDRVSSPEPDSLSGQIFEVSADTVPVQMAHNSLDIYTTITFLILFLLGAGKRYTEYTKEVAR